MASDKNKQVQNISLSTWTMVRAVLIILAVWLFYILRDVMVILFAALILASAFDTWVDFMNKRWKMPRALGMVSIYAVLLVVISLVFILLVPPIAKEIRDLSNSFPIFWERATQSLGGLQVDEATGQLPSGIQEGLKSLEAGINRAAGSVFSTISTFFGGVISFFIVLVITFYIVVEDNAMKRILPSLVPDKYLPYVSQLTARMQTKIGLWLQGELVLMLIIFILSFIGLSVLGVKYALVLALLAGLLELVPYLGPILSAIPAVFLAFTQSPFKALLVIILYLVIQQAENHIIVPKVMQRAVGLNPVISIVALLIGAKLAGVAGMLLAIPVATAVSVVVRDIFEDEEKEKVAT